MSDEEHDHDLDEGQAAAAVDSGRGAAEQRSDHHSSRQRNRMMVGVLAVGLGVLSWGAYEYAWAPNRVVEQAKVLPKSENVLAAVAPPPVETRTVTSRLVVEPSTAVFGQLIAGREHQTVSFTLTARDGPVDIENIVLPFAQSNGLDMRAETCQGHKLGKNDTCVVSLTFSPLQAMNLSNNILVQGTTYDSGGQSSGATHHFSNALAVIGASVAPPPDPPKPVVIDYDKARMNGLQSSFLSARAHSTLAEQAGKSYWNGPKPPVDKDWSSLGFEKDESSLPVDMTRVVTMDKPIPVVLKTTIDARNPSRAVATVERDVYGGDGRLVVIERGSTLVGRVAAVADSSEEKVGIEWQRLMRPDGVMFRFEATTGDAMGRAGALAHIDNRWLERFGTTGLASLVEAGITIGIGGSTTSTTQNGTNVTGYSSDLTTGGTTTIAQNARAVASQQLRQDLQPLYEQFKREQLALPVIRTVPAGTRMTVWPSTDLWLKEVPVGQVVQAQSQAGSLGGAKGLYGQAGAGGASPGELAGASGSPSVAAADMSLGNKTASGMLRDRMTMTGSSAGSTSVNPSLAAYGRSGAAPGYAAGTTSYGGTPASALATNGVQTVAAPPWSVAQ